MYCSECKLRVADDKITVCPVCQRSLQPEVEKESVPDQDQGLELHDGFVVGSQEDQGIDFDPEALGLKSSERNKGAEDVNDMRVLADLWEEEDIAADLDGVFAEAFSIETVDLIPEDPDEPEAKQASGTLNTELFEEPVRSRNLWLPILLVAGLIVVAGGWFLLKGSGVEPGSGVSGASKEVPALVESQVEPAAEKPVTTETASETATTPTAEFEAEQPELSTAAVAAGDNVDSGIETAVPAAAEVAVQSLTESAEPSDAGTAPLKTAGVQSDMETSPEVETPPAETPPESSTSPESDVIAELTKAEKVSPPPVLAPGKSAGGAAPAEAAAGTGQSAASFTPAAAVAAGIRYVVHVGSFRNIEGAARQLAKLHKKGFTAYSVEVDLGEKGVWQRIFIPGGASRSDAKLVQEKLAELLPREDSLIRKLSK